MTRRPESAGLPRRSRLPALLLLGVVVVAAAITLLPRLNATRIDPGAVQTDAARLRSSSAQLELGKRVYLRHCAFCHGDQGQGSQFGTSLKHVGTAYVDYMLTTGRMPLLPYGTPNPVQGHRRYLPTGPASYKPSVIKAIDAYTATFITSGPEVPTMKPGEDPYDGRSIYLLNCAPCHGSSGTGMIVTNGAWSPELFQATPRTVGDAIRVGPKAMPPFTKSQISDKEMNDVATYVEQLGGYQVIGGASLDQFGPIVEGIVAWLIPIPVLVVIIRLLGKRTTK